MTGNSYERSVKAESSPEKSVAGELAGRAWNWVVRLFKDCIAVWKDKTMGMDSILLGLILLLVAVGLVMLYSASYASASYYIGDSGYYIKRQLVFAAVGLALMFAFSFVPAERWKGSWKLWLLASYILLIVVLIKKYTVGEDGESGELERWINIFGISVQPSEITKLAIIMFFAYWASTRPDLKTHPFLSLIPYGIVLGSSAILLIAQPHLSGTVLIVFIGGTLLLVAGIKMNWFCGIAVAGVALFTVLVVFDIGGYWKERFIVLADPYSDPLGAGWQNIQAMYAMASGGLFGQGFGNSRQKYLYISAPQNDFIFAVICEELGFVGAVLILGLFLVFVWRGFTVSLAAPGRFQKLLGIGITAQIGWQALFNIGVVTRVLPNTGISLPFFSYGGSSLLMLLFEMGILLSISRNSTIKRI